jgi:SAM-dependent methyltransferase
MNFGPLYSAGYNLLNEGKDYKKELDFVFETVSAIVGKEFIPKSVIDFGCGSGKHLAELQNSIERVVGVDRSKDMLSAAFDLLPNEYELIHSDIGSFNTSESFDLVFSLFHVASYQTTFQEIVAYWNTISSSLSMDGFAFIDFWNRTAWDQEPPERRVTEKSNELTSVRRVSTPTIDFLSGIVDLDITVTFSGSENKEEEYHEQHRLRAFTLLEVQLAAKLVGLDVVKAGGWLDASSPLSPSDWYGYVILTHQDRK